MRFDNRRPQHKHKPPTLLTYGCHLTSGRHDRSILAMHNVETEHALATAAVRWAYLHGTADQLAAAIRRKLRAANALWAARVDRRRVGAAS